MMVRLKLARTRRASGLIAPEALRYVTYHIRSWSHWQTGRAALHLLGDVQPSRRVRAFLCTAENMRCTPKGCVQKLAHLLGQFGVAP